MDQSPSTVEEDEHDRLRRDRALAVTTLQEIVAAHRGLGSEADSGREVRRWDTALRQAEEALYDLTRRRAGDGRPVVYYYCELPGGHAGTHSVLPHTVRFVHGPTEGE